MQLNPAVSSAELIQAPVMFLQSGFPLKISIFLQGAADKGVSLFKPRGSVLSLEELLSLRKMPPRQVLTSKKEYDAAVAFLKSGVTLPSSDDH